MTDIIVTIPKELSHKKCGLAKVGRDNVDKIPYWLLRTKPSKFNKGDWLWFVKDGYIVGKKQVTDIEVTEEGIKLILGKYESIDPVPHKPFRGFRYYDR